ncbi:uncharacterized protein LOC133033406 [Cannabis sativa]|uniref:uncharacterized protein LOC133033406 n=1 Tax=Cannabis sativa TaxID=3483 RepID=UPI0029CA436F|nr:uncharacterized protein LOC133033406 [Cannabis sativa]
MTLEVNVFNIGKQPLDNDECFQSFLIDTLISEEVEAQYTSTHLNDHFEISEISESGNTEINSEVINQLPTKRTMFWNPIFEGLPQDRETPKPSTVQAPQPNLAQLPKELKHVFLGANNTFPVIISSTLNATQEQQLINVLTEQRGAIGWTLADIKGISPLICSHHIKLEDGAIPRRDPQRRLNPPMKEVVKTEILKLLDYGILYPVADSKWVSPTQVVPKKSGVTRVPNDKGELIPTKVTTGWRMCIDYRKLNAATCKDHFPLPFIDQILERVADHPFYSFLDGYSGYYQIEIAL